MAIWFGRKKRYLPRLLIVESEPLVAFDSGRLLADAGYHIVAITNRVDHAVGMILDGTPIDLVLADVAAHDGSSIDVARVAVERGIAVLFVSSDCPAPMRALASGCLAKPYAPRALLMAIEAIEAVTVGARPRRLPSGFRLFRDAA